MSGKNFDAGETAKRYADGPPRFVPGYEAMQALCAQLLAERAKVDGHILVLGAGGGLELLTLAHQQTGWQFTGIDPSAAMLSEARRRISDDGVADRVELVEGYISDAPQGPFDGATCLLTLHFIPDDGSKLETLKAIRQRLRPNAAFVLVDLCVNYDAPDAELRLDRFSTFAINAAVDREAALQTRTQVRNRIASVSPERQKNLMSEAGFTHIETFYQGLSWLGLVGYA